MNIAILVPSHIRHDNQIKFFSECLNSLLNQTYRVDIYVSISYENQYVGQIKGVIEKFKGVNFKIISTKQSQFQHLHNLIEDVQKYDLIMFCDDDDMYDLDRVKFFVEKYKEVTIKNLLAIKDDSYWTGYTTDTTAKGEYYNNEFCEINADEYISYAIKPLLLKLFFEEISEYNFIETSPFCDCLFRYWIPIVAPPYKFNLFNKTLYKYRKTAGSVCHEQNMDNIQKMIFERKIDMMTNELFLTASIWANVEAQGLMNTFSMR